jgi:hypothetical protein
MVERRCTPGRALGEPIRWSGFVGRQLMVKIHLVGGENLVVEIADPSGVRSALKDPNDVIEVTHDGKSVLIPVRAIAAFVFLS